MKYRIIAIGTVASCLCAIAYVVYAATVVSIDSRQYYQVVSVMDGDTFKAKVGLHTITVRMLGIDTPETVDPRKPEQCYGREASDESKKLLIGQSVRLEFNPHREQQDKYHRYLGYVYLKDGLLLNEYLLREGFAREYTYGKAYSRQQEFKSVQEGAQKGKKGLWSVCE